MYGSNFYPDGLTKEVIDRLIVEVFGTADDAVPATSGLLSGAAARRRSRRIERRVLGDVVRTLPIRHVAERREVA